MISDKINIAIVEDNSRFRSNLKKYFDLMDGFNIVFAADSVETALVQLEDNLDVEILLLDIGLPGMSGLDGIPHIKKLAPSLDIIMLTSYEEEQKIVKALCTGASSYITKRSSLEEISTAVEVVHKGGSYMSPSIAREIVKYFAKGQTLSKEKILSPRQREIMELMINGKTYSAIAKSLAVSTETVKSHIKKIYTNLHVNNKAEAIVKYLSA